MKVVSTEKAPAAIGPYSQAMVLNGVVYTSGQIAIDPAVGDVTATTIEGQAEQVMKNLGEVLKAAGVTGTDRCSTLVLFFNLISRADIISSAKENVLT